MKVTLSQYKEDLANTVKEIKAYKMLSEGFTILAELPENKEVRHLHSLRASNYNQNRIDCETLYETLLRINTEDLA